MQKTERNVKLYELISFAHRQADKFLTYHLKHFRTIKGPAISSA